MGLETVTFISDLVITNPVGATDPKSQGDDHIRNLKIGLKNTFPNITGAVTLTQAQINDAALKSASNTFTQSSFGSTAAVRIVADNPGFVLRDADGSSDAKEWLWAVESGTYRLYTRDDTSQNGNDAIEISRSGTTVVEIELNATTLDFNGDEDLSGTLIIGSATASTTAPALRVGGSGTTTSSYVASFLGAGTNAAIGVLDTSNSLEFGIFAQNASSRFSVGSRSNHGLGLITNNTTRLYIEADGSEIQLDATTLDFNASADISGSLSVHSFLELEATSTILLFDETDASSDERQWRIGTNGGVWRLDTYTDAGVLGTGAIIIDRTGTTVSEIELNATAFDLNGNLDVSGTLTTPNTSASEVGFKGAPKNQQSDNYTLVLTDAGKLIEETGSAKTVTIPANASVAFPIGTLIGFIANGDAVSIAITTDILYFAGTAFGSTGTRTLANGGVAFAYKFGSQHWMIWGTGLS